MAKVIVQHEVADYDRWLPVFTEHEPVRRRHGATGHTISRDSANPNNLVVVNDFASLDGARGFASDPSLPDVMANAGVTGHPQVWIVDDAESRRY
jgi:hypothetical protein